MMNSMYVITFLELGRGVLNSVFARKVPFLLCSSVFPWQREKETERERDMSNPKIQKPDL